MKINITKIDDAKVAVNNTATLVFKVNEFPNYTLLHTQVSGGVVARTVQNENTIVIWVEETETEMITGSVYLYYITDAAEQGYIEFIDKNKCIKSISINNFELIADEDSLIDRLSPYGQVLTYKIAIEGLEEAYDISTILLPEDAYLLEPNKTMCIKYNPEVSSLKRNYIDVITPTLGRETPFIRRAGVQKYKTFTLGGMISIEAEVDDNPWDDNTQTNTRSLLTADDEKILEAIDNMQLSTYDSRAVKEKLYRERILDYLEDGKIKLFKSVQEGNIFVYLSAVTLTSDKTSGRNLYSFSCTATEVQGNPADYGVKEEE